MSGLKVTDVQEALRNFAGVGHDLISDPYKFKLDDKEYQSLHNRLTIRNYTDMHGSPFKVYDIMSHIGHGESPVISTVGSSGNSKGHQIERMVQFSIPRVEHVNGEHHSSWVQHSDRDEQGWIKNHPSGFWFPNGRGFTGRAYGEIKDNMVDPTTATHDMIERHSKGDIPEHGHYLEDGDSKKAIPLRGENFRHFNVEKATNALTSPLPPRYSLRTPNLVYVTHRGEDYDNVLSTHVYDPDTEQLIETDKGNER